MSCAQLLAGDVAGWARAVADEPGALWVFQHIPKTAGSSLALELGRRLPPAANVHADHANFSRPPMETLEESLQAFLQELPARRYRLVSGHLRGPQVQRIRAAHAPLRLLTVLREPVARVVSDYRYMRTPAHPSHQRVIAEFPSFEDYLADPRSQDKMFRFLRPRARASVEETIAHLERHYALVATLEHYAPCTRLLFALLGGDAAPQVHARKTEARQDNRVDNLEALRPQVLAANAQDLALYQHFAQRLEAVRDPIERWLALPR